MTADITSLIRQFHQAVVDRDFDAAWGLLSERKRQQNERQTGFDTWQTNQASLSDYLDPANVTVEIESLDDTTGVARIRVSGMTWSKPGASCTEWAGITWVKYEDGAWRYDPGYSTTPQRRRDWQGRVPELLGGSCGG